MEIASVMAVFSPLSPCDITGSSLALRSPLWKVTALCFSLSQDRIQIEQGALSLTAVQLSDAGMYQCVAENKHGVVFSNAELGVTGECHAGAEGAGGRDQVPKPAWAHVRRKQKG